MTTPPPATPRSTTQRSADPPSASPPSGPGPRPRPAPWVRTRLRAAPLGALLAAALAFVAVLLAAALPRAQDRGADQALRSFLEHTGAGRTSLQVTAPAPASGQSAGALDRTLASLLARTGNTFRVDPDAVVHGTRTVKRQPLLNPELSRPHRLAPEMSLLYIEQARDHVKLVEGRWPSDDPRPAGSGADEPPLRVALSKEAADTIGARVGSVLRSAPLTGGTASVEVTGLYAVTDKTADVWVNADCVPRACKKFLGESYLWEADALIGAGDLDRMHLWAHDAEDFWRLPVDVGTLRADRLDATKEEIASYVAGPTAAALTFETRRERLRTTAWLPELLEQAHARTQAAAPLAAIGPAGVGGVAFVVLCLAGALAGDRREAELRLLLARGGSRAGIVGRLVGEGAVTVLPAAAAATTLAVLLLLPTPRLAPALVSAAAVALVALLAFPVRAAVMLSPRRPAGRWRRPVAELLVLTATAAAVLEVRRRGVAPAGEDPDPLLVAAPLLLALCGGLVLARLLPLVTGLLARAAGRRPGLVGFLGLARAARGSGSRGTAAAGGRSGPSVLSTVALLLAVTAGGFGAAVLESVDSSRLTVARLTVGGDAAISAYGKALLPDGLAKAAGELPGVRTSVPLWIDHDSTLLGGPKGSTQVTVIVAEPAAYAELSRALGCGSFDPGLLSGGAAQPADAPVPALVSSGLAGRAGAQDAYVLRPGDGRELRARVAGVIDCTPARPARDAATVVLPSGPATALIGADRPNRWFGLGSPDGERLRALVGAALPASPTGPAPAATAAPAATTEGPAAGQPPASVAQPADEVYPVRTSADVVAELGADPLQRSAQRLFWASVAAAAGFALLAVLLTLMRTVPERAALLARLRTMGLRRRQGVALILAETLPQTVAAALGGAGVAAAAVALLGPALDLSTLVGTRVPTGVRLTAWPVLTQALGLAALVAAAVLVEAATSGRRQITTELRAGDQR
ncbi:hypothetical protein AB0892_01375 [Streptomyces sp. NPDC005409]|uniref:hypothetical protein n=1 Tax=Streptomyces sp. NPDC005409 TaxID=3155342 RepID=UPI0034568F88